MHRPKDASDRIVILGGGLTGLTAGLVLSRAGRSVQVLERGPEVGGLARTIARNGFRFDLGGHRFFTKDEKVAAFLGDLMGGELVTVPRTSKILLKNRYVDYPLRPFNALFGLGVPTTIRSLLDYAGRRIVRGFKEAPIVSLEDWVVDRFGRTLYNVYFKEYSEKVWGIDCERICMEWIDQRIQGLSLRRAIKEAFLGSNGGGMATLADRFLYPAGGIGRIAENLQEGIERNGRVLTDARIGELRHDGLRLERAVVNGPGSPGDFPGEEFVSTLPLTSLVGMLRPRPPEDIVRAASRLRYRDLVIVAVMIDRPRATDQTWIYVPDRSVPFGRIHEPTNWSRKMAPEGKTLLVTEHFCFQGGDVWRTTDERLVGNTVSHLARLGFVKPDEVEDAAVVRVPHAYPVFEVGYERSYRTILDYLGRFENLHVAGRTGAFKYLNMDHVIAAGIDAAERIIARTPADFEMDREDADLAELNA
ncbi:MAG: FAD-dependent oxidoreductase [Nitrospirae bacterium]|nr:FAD-dependent oxidoreductase [Nitrospirota bacterium]